MYSYNHPGLSDLLLGIITSNCSGEKTEWLINQSKEIDSEKSILSAKKIFSLIARKIKRADIIIDAGDLEPELKNTGIASWDIQRLCRVWFLMQIEPLPKEIYVETIDNLFNDAEMHELAALYSALPYLAYPESWVSRCEEGIRSNLGNVLEAIMVANPYPAANLDDLAWNQLVLKAFFTEKDVSKIIGFEDRMNEKLINSLRDYAAERTAANRPVHEKIKEILELYKTNDNVHTLNK